MHNLIKELKLSFSSLLNTETLNADDDLFELGATSFTMVQAVEKIQSRYGISVPVEVLLDAPTINAIAHYLEGELTTQQGKNEQRLVETPTTKVMVGHEGLEAELLSYFSALLDDGALTSTDDLFEMGATSFTMVQVVEKIQNDYAVTIAVEVFLDEPNVHAIVRHLAEIMESKNNESRVAVPEKTAVKVLAEDNYLEAVLTGYFLTLLDLEELAINDDLFELGATSFTMVQIVDKIQNDYAVTIPVEALLDEPTIRAIAEYVANILSSETHPASSYKDEGTVMNSSHDSMIDVMSNSESIIKLQDVEFCNEAYPNSVISKKNSQRTISLDIFGGFLSLLQQQSIDKEPRYLYASAGGLNPIQTYIYVKKDSVERLEEGIYYYHHKQHSLYPISIGAKISRSAFFDYNRDEFDNAGFVVFFIAQMKAIMPVYRDSSSLLSVLESGYMGQLLSGRQAVFNLELSPVSGVDFAAIREQFKLDDGHKFIHSILGSTSGDVSLGQERGGLFEYLQATNKGIHAHCSNYIDPINSAVSLSIENENVSFPTKEEKDKILRGVNIRQFPSGSACIQLPQQTFEEDYYKVRATKRDYADTAVPLEKFSKFLSLLRLKKVGGSYRSLYSSVTQSHSVKVYLYIKDKGVQGIAKGVYCYNPVLHELTLVSQDLSVELKSCYTPFNRKHAKKSKFCLFLVAPIGDLKKTFDEESAYLALLDAGYMGQLLMDKQAEFDMGVCPIGGLLFDKIRDDFQLGSEDLLLHSFVCGSHQTQMPADWRFLEVDKRNSDISPSHVSATEENPLVGSRQDIAIVGMSGRYPDAENLDRFWKNLQDGQASFKDLAFEQATQYRRSDLLNNRLAHLHHRGAFLKDIDCFDSLLFKISPLEARSIDPQERLLMEVVWECLENGGYTSDELNRVSEKVGVFVGAMWDDYQHHAANNVQDGRHIPVISLHSSIPNSISHFFEFNGPSIALNTSCSSAMTAIHYACNSIINGECRAAVVGGVNIMSHPYHHQMLQGLGLLSADGNSNPFGKLGSGFVPGEGVGAILLKSKRDAQRDGDYIHGIIKGTAVGYSGKSVGNGLSKPKQQKESMLSAIENAGICANSISYIEAAAPGASIADATEISAVKEVFQSSDGNKSTVYIGSVKSNIGHLESASAMSQLMKVLMQMKHKKICPTINVGAVNPLIQLKDSGLEIVKELKAWESFSQQKNDDHSEDKCLPRRALINAFGATGSGGHAVIEEYINEETIKDDSESLILLSAATELQLKQLAQRLYDYLINPESPRRNITDIAYTLRMGRIEMAERVAMVVKSHADLQQKLSDFIRGCEKISECFRGQAVKREAEHASHASNLLTVAEKWVNGTRFSWDGFNKGNEQKVPLPTYPFAKERHWVRADGVPEAFDQNDQVGANAALGNEQDSSTEDTLRIKVEDYLKAIFSEVSEIAISRIGSEATFDEYGINSLMITKLNSLLEKDFGELSKTLFFEYQSIRGLANYFLINHLGKLNTRFNHTDSSAVKKASSSNDVIKESGRKGIVLSTSDSQTEKACDVAIIGLSGKYPRSDTVEEYWDNLQNAVDCISEIPKSRWDYHDYYDPDRTSQGTIRSKWGGFINGVDEFDPLFFNISPREAEFMDPQERLFLQTVWHTFEDAGYSPASKEIFRRKIGVFVGVMYGEYQLFSSSNSTNKEGMAVGASYGSIANRISYTFNLTGPSMAIDTLCSSSLTALHLAVKSIKSGECEAAIVGGVNLSIHPNKYIMQAQGNMSSSDGRCRSFGDGGDGFVASEGVGAILVKPLNKAIADGDNIYGVIKGTSINNDGKTHGYTVPNPNAHAEMVVDALQESGINPEWVSYIEAHGTGTSLGDPIEITGLTKAFSRFTEKKKYCAIGSAKSNIGHTEAVAGIAGITKILLQMKYQKLAPSLHSTILNPNINFEQSPFYVQQSLASWDRPRIESNGEVIYFPRIACISSLGAGGSNAHAIIQEYAAVDVVENDEQPTLAPLNSVMIPLSAKNAERLQDYTRQLMLFIENTKLSGKAINLVDLAYTLQVGREAMGERIGFIVSSVQELLEKLQSLLGGDKNIEGVHFGQGKEKRTFSLFDADDDMASIAQVWISKGKYRKLLDLWVNGFDFDWNALYTKGKPNRISAPKYPFAKERYWVESGVNISGIKSNLSAIHPLLHENTSDLSEQRFTSTFMGAEFFLRDHKVKGESVLPGVGYLEMARAAVEKAAGDLAPGTIITLNNVVWTQPIVVSGAAKAVHIGLSEADNEQLHFDIYSQSSLGEEIIHSQGEVAFLNNEAPSHLDLRDIRAQMTQGVLDADTCYRAFDAMGLCYGAGHRGIQEIYQGEEQVLAQLALPPAVLGTQQDYLLHPSLMDAALQSSIGLILHNTQQQEDEALQVTLPFALDSLAVIAACTQKMYAWVRRSDSASEKVQKLDIDLCDEQGQVCVRMRGFSSRVLEKDVGVAHAKDDMQKTGTLFAKPVWQAAPVAETQPPQSYAEHHVMLCGLEAVQPDELSTLIPAGQCRAMPAPAAATEVPYNAYAVACFEQLKALMQAKPQGRVLVQILVPNTPTASVLAGLSGLLKTAMLENPQFVGQLIQVDPAQRAAVTAQQLQESAKRPNEALLKYEHGSRWVQRWEAVPVQAGHPESAFKEGGVYLITGGLGGLGLLFAHE
ncbi:beta-ketoacyl synthase N-terminal-like domain-containing protein, partial [Serratia proteamaculans]